MLATEPARHGYRVPRVTFHLGRWIRTTDFYPDFQTRLYDRRAARWQGNYVHESVSVDGPAGQLRHELQHYSYRDLRDHLERINHYTSARRAADARSAAAAPARSTCWCSRRPPSCATTSCGAASSTAPPA